MSNEMTSIPTKHRVYASVFYPQKEPVFVNGLVEVLGQPAATRRVGGSGLAQRKGARNPSSSRLHHTRRIEPKCVELTFPTDILAAGVELPGADISKVVAIESARICCIECACADLTSFDGTRTEDCIGLDCERTSRQADLGSKYEHFSSRGVHNQTFKDRAERCEREGVRSQTGRAAA